MAWLHKEKGSHLPDAIVVYQANTSPSCMLDRRSQDENSYIHPLCAHRRSAHEMPIMRLENALLFSAKLILIPVRIHFVQDIQAFAEALIVDDLTLAQEAQGCKILLTIGKIH